MGEPWTDMYLLDTNVISEARKGVGANPGVRQFFSAAKRDGTPLYLTVITLGEVRQGIERIRHRGDQQQADRLERWLTKVKTEYEDYILPFESDAADIWGRLRVLHAENPLDKQIAATALIYDLTVVTRNIEHFRSTGACAINPFIDPS